MDWHWENPTTGAEHCRQKRWWRQFYLTTLMAAASKQGSPSALVLLGSGLLLLPRTLRLVTYSMPLRATAPFLVLQTVEPLILSLQPGQRTPRLRICGHKGGATVAGGNEFCPPRRHPHDQRLRRETTVVKSTEQGPSEPLQK